MEKRNTLLLTVIAVATLLVAVVGATFAYFASTTTVTNRVEVTANTTGSTAAFTTVLGGENADGVIALDVNSALMLDQGSDQEVSAGNGATDSAEYVIGLSASNNSYCKYYLTYVDNGTDTYVPSAAATGKNEFTIQIGKTSTTYALPTGAGTTVWTDVPETQYNTFVTAERKWISEAQYIGVTTANGSEATASDTYLATVKMYNLAGDQSSIAGKKFAGYLTVATDAEHAPKCY